MVWSIPGSTGLSDKLDEDRGSAESHTERSTAGADRAPGSPKPAARRQWLERTIEGEIIPRLMLAHRDQCDVFRGRTCGQAALSAAAINTLTAMVLECDTPDAIGFIRQLEGDEVDFDSLCFELLTKTARRLGEMWEQDLCDFTDVTVGLGRLHSILRQLSREQPTEALVTTANRRILLTPVPGEQHTFGSEMVGEIFRRAGWSVHGDPSMTKGHLIDRAHEEAFPIVGLSLAAECWIDSLAETVAGLRRAFGNRESRIVVGGPVFIANPALASLVCADAVSVSGRHALLQAEGMIQAAPSLR